MISVGDRVIYKKPVSGKKPGPEYEATVLRITPSKIVIQLSVLCGKRTTKNVDVTHLQKVGVLHVSRG